MCINFSTGVPEAKINPQGSGNKDDYYSYYKRWIAENCS